MIMSSGWSAFHRRTISAVFLPMFPLLFTLPLKAYDRQAIYFCHLGERLGRGQISRLLNVLTAMASTIPR